MTKPGQPEADKCCTQAASKQKSFRAWLFGAVVGLVTGIIITVAADFIRKMFEPITPEVRSPFAPAAPLEFEADVTVGNGCITGQLASYVPSIEEQTNFKFPNGAERVRICDDVRLAPIAPSEFPAALTARYPGCFHVEMHYKVGTNIHRALQVITTSPAICRAPIAGRSADEPGTSEFSPLLCIGSDARSEYKSTLRPEDFQSVPRDCTAEELQRFRWE